MPGANQDPSGPLSGLARVTVSNTEAVIANLYAKNKQIQDIVTAVVTAYGNEAVQVLVDESPEWLGHMKELAKVRFTEKRRGFEAGWWRSDFLGKLDAEGRPLRWYIPFVLFGTRRRAANPVHRRMERRVMPRFTRALATAIRREAGDA